MLVGLFQILTMANYLYNILNTLIYMRLNENIEIGYVLGFDVIKAVKNYFLRKWRKQDGADESRAEIRLPNVIKNGK